MKPESESKPRAKPRVIQIVIIVLCVAAVGALSTTFLGRAASSKFSSVGYAIGGGGQGVLSDVSSAGAAPAGVKPQTQASPPATVADVKALDLPPAQAGRKVVSNGSVTLEVDDVVAIKAKARDAVEAAGGYTFGEQTTASGQATSNITFKVPPENFEKVIGELSALGPLKSVEVKTDDVTQQVVDLDARIRAAQASLDRVRELVSRTNDIVQLANLENEVQRRQTEYESLQGQRRTLADRSDVATIVLTLNTTSPPPPAPVAAASSADTSPPGFLDGLRVGWNGFVKAITVVGAAIGVLLPFAWLALVPAAVVVVRGRRRRLMVTDGP